MAGARACDSRGAQWQLTLLQLFPAVWIWAMTWNMKNHLLSKPTFSTSAVVFIAVGVLLAAQVAYWCNGTFAYTMAQSASADIKAAFGEARPHWRLISGLALLTGGVQAAIWLAMPRLHTDWLWVALLAMFVVQVYLFIAIPCWLLGVRKTGSAARASDPDRDDRRPERRGRDAGLPVQPDRLAVARIRRTRDRRRRAPCHRSRAARHRELVGAGRQAFASTSTGRPCTRVGTHRQRRQGGGMTVDRLASRHDSTAPFHTLCRA
jgi:hypothetical protein